MSVIGTVNNWIGEVGESVGEGVLWWGVKYVDYFQPDLMGAAQGYSDRCDRQWFQRGPYLYNGNDSNPLIEIMTLLIGEAIKLHGIDKIEEIAKNTLKFAGKAIIKTYGVTFFIKGLADVILQDIVMSVGIGATISKISSLALSSTIGLTVTLNSTQFKAAKAYSWLGANYPLECQLLVSHEIDAFFFLVIAKIEPYLKG